MSLAQVHNDSLDHALFSLVNEFRKENKLKPLVWNDDIHKASNYHSGYLEALKKEDCSHVEFKKIKGFKLLKEPEDRINKFCGKEYIESLENVAYDSEIDSLANSVFEMWKSSTAGHRETMLTKGKNLKAACCLVIGDLGGYGTLNIIRP